MLVNISGIKFNQLTKESHNCLVVTFAPILIAKPRMLGNSTSEVNFFFSHIYPSPHPALD